MTSASERIIGNYQILRTLGEGGMGAVYEAMDLMLQRPVAIKMLRPEIARRPELIDRFRAEAVTLARLSHGSIATLYNLMQERGEYYMVMEFVPGRTLEAVLRSTGRLAAYTAAEVMRQVLDAMAHAYSHGVLHRDIKPANIMIQPGGAVKVTDFGIARILGGSRMTREGGIVGTLEYISPERIRGQETGIQSDIYSAGVVLYELLGGRLPFVSDTEFGLMQAHLTAEPPPLANLGYTGAPHLEAIVRRAMAKRPEDRFASAEEFRDALTGFLGARPAVQAAARPVPAGAVRPFRSTWPALGAALAVLLGVLAGGAVLARRLPASEVTLLPSPPRPAAPPDFALRLVPTFGGDAATTGEQPAKEPPATATTSLAAKVPVNPTLVAQEQLAPLPVTTPPVPAPTPLSSSPSAATAPAQEPAIAHHSAPPEIRTLAEIRTLYIEPMADALDAILADEIRQQLGNRIQLVSSRDAAQAVMTGAGQKRGGSRITANFRDQYSAAVSVVTVHGGHVLWNAEAGDRSTIGVVKHGGPRKVAERLIATLRKALQ